MKQPPPVDHIFIEGVILLLIASVVFAIYKSRQERGNKDELKTFFFSFLGFIGFTAIPWLVLYALARYWLLH